jgi:hypothetical protein
MSVEWAHEHGVGPSMGAYPDHPRRPLSFMRGNARSKSVDRGFAARPQVSQTLVQLYICTTLLHMPRVASALFTTMHRRAARLTSADWQIIPTPRAPPVVGAKQYNAAKVAHLIGT